MDPSKAFFLVQIIALTYLRLLPFALPAPLLGWYSIKSERLQGVCDLPLGFELPRGLTILGDIKIIPHIHTIWQDSTLGLFLNLDHEQPYKKYPFHRLFDNKSNLLQSRHTYKNVLPLL